MLHLSYYDKSEKLICTILFEEINVGKSRCFNALEEYQKFEQLIDKLNCAGKTIPGLDNFSLVYVNGIAQTLFSRKTIHHRSCRQNITPMSIARAEVRAGCKRKRDENSEQDKPLTLASLEGKRVFFS